jgi:hypothetical protein
MEIAVMGLPLDHNGNAVRIGDIVLPVGTEIEMVVTAIRNGNWIECRSAYGDLGIMTLRCPAQEIVALNEPKTSLGGKKMDRITIDDERIDRLVREHNDIISADNADSIDRAEAMGIRRALRLLGFDYIRNEDKTLAVLWHRGA